MFSACGCWEWNPPDQVLPEWGQGSSCCPLKDHSCKGHWGHLFSSWWTHHWKGLFIIFTIYLILKLGKEFFRTFSLNNFSSLNTAYTEPVLSDQYLCINCLGLCLINNVSYTCSLIKYKKLTIYETSVIILQCIYQWH